MAQAFLPAQIEARETASWGIPREWAILTARQCPNSTPSSESLKLGHRRFLHAIAGDEGLNVGTVEIIVDEPIPTEGLTRADIETLITRVRDCIDNNLTPAPQPG